MLPVADEIIVIDSFSTDETKEICEQKRVRFIQHIFEGHIEQKNFAVAQASHDYVLSLDADEVLSTELQTTILSTKNNWQYDGYVFNRLNNFCGHWVRHGDWYPDRKLRLWDRRKGRWGGNNPHDKVILEKGTRQGFLKGDLLHYSFTSIEQHIRQINHFSSIGAKVLFQKGKKATAYHLYMKPFFKFFIAYFLKKGFLDGYYGFVISWNSAHAMFLKYAKLREMNRATLLSK